MQAKKQQLEPDMEQWTGSKLAKEYIKALYCHPVYLTYMQITSCKMPGWVKHKPESRLLGEISITSDNADDTTFMADSEEELKSLFMKVKEETEKPGLKLNSQKMKIMTSGPITSWQIHGETVETVVKFILGGAPKSLQLVIAATKLKDSYSLEGKLLTNLGSILKTRGITLPMKLHLIKPMVFPVVMYGCVSWTIKKAER